MEYSEIKKIISDMEKSTLSEISIEFPDGTKISVKNANKESANMPVSVQTVSTQTAVVSNDIPKQEMKTPCKEDENLKVVTSPMVGTFYAKPSPDKEPFVTIGKKVCVGETLCIIEAMKLMNEIEAEVSGEIVEILVKDGEMVDYGKPLFKMKEA